MFQFFSPKKEEKLYEVAPTNSKNYQRQKLAETPRNADGREKNEDNFITVAAAVVAS